MTTPVAPVLDRTSATMLLSLAAVWGGSFFFAEIALTDLPPLTITLFRVVLAVPILGLIVRQRGLALPRSSRVWGAYLVMGALNNAIPFSLIFWGQTRIDSGLAAILNGTTAVFAALLAGLLLADEPLTRNRVAGAALGLAGVAVIMGPGALRGLDPGNLAQLAVLGAALSYALAGVWARRMLSGQPPLVNALGMLVCSSLLMAPIAMAVDGLPDPGLPRRVWAALIGIASLSTALAYILYFAILARAGAGNLLLVTLLIPPFAMGLGAAFLGERPGPEAWIGFAVIALGITITDGRLHAWVLGRMAGAKS